MAATGHAKNVANFETTTIILNDLGAGYNPTQTLITPAALQAKLTEAKAVMTAVDAAQATDKIAANARADEYEKLDKLAVNVKRAAEVDINDDLFTGDLTSITRKFHGRRAGDAPVDSPSTAGIDESKATRPVSERSFDNQVALFADLIALLKTQTAYKPNEPDVQISTLETKLAALEAKNNAAKTTKAALGSALDARNEILYDENTGLIKLAQLIKKQIARVPGKDSAAYAQINALEFRKF